ncbi:hypothetical protein CPB97_008993 [Podila verticillata]|nr:hypothetical protein CPB97_008993 [Podila verticillata]
MATVDYSLAPYMSTSLYRPLSPSSSSTPSSTTRSPILSSSTPPSPKLNLPDMAQHHTSFPTTPSYLHSPSSSSERLLESSLIQRQQHEQQLRDQLARADHPLHQTNPESLQKNHQQLASQLEYYRQLQIMHKQRARDIEMLHQQQQQQSMSTFHCIKRYQLVQRMLQVQKMHHAQQIQKIQYMQRLNNLQQQLPHAMNMNSPPSPSSTLVHSPSEKMPRDSGDLAKLDIDSNTIHIPVQTTRPVAFQELLTGALPHSPHSLMSNGPTMPRNTHVPELTRITLPSLDQIRKQRQQRLKYQHRLRQSAASVKREVEQQQQPSTGEIELERQEQGDGHGKHRSCHYSPPNATPKNGSSPVTPSRSHASVDVMPSPCATIPAMTSGHFRLNHNNHAHSKPSSPVNNNNTNALAKQIQASVWTSSITSIVPRSRADLHYKRQMRHNMALQQHMIQDHTNRYRIYQAFCLLQRAREAQALDELQTQRKKQQQTLAWVQALRQASELEIPQ